MNLFFSRRFAGAVVGAALVAATLGGCSGGASTKNPSYNQNTGLFLTADQPVGGGIGHLFLELSNGIPQREGVELTPAALSGLRVQAIGSATPSFIGPVPSKTNGSPLTYGTLTALTPDASTGQSPYLSLVLTIRALQTTSDPYYAERAPVSYGETPPGFVLVGDGTFDRGVVVPGAGALYADSRQAQPLISPGQTLLYYTGHLNGFMLNATVAQLQSKATITQSIAQPTLYPVEGYYPTSWTVTFDAVRGTHVIELGNFIRASGKMVVPPGTPGGS